MKKKNLDLAASMNLVLSNQLVENEINIPVIQKVKEDDIETTVEPIVSEPSKAINKASEVNKNKISKASDQDVLDSITLLLYSDLKLSIDQHVINYDIKYNSFYTNVINYFYQSTDQPIFEKINEELETVKVRIVCNKEDKKNIRLFVKENKITLREFFTAYIKLYLNRS